MNTAIRTVCFTLLLLALSCGAAAEDFFHVIQKP